MGTISVSVISLYNLSFAKKVMIIIIPLDRPSFMQSYSMDILWNCVAHHAPLRLSFN